MGCFMLKIVKLSFLYDFYGQLLTEKQQKSFELYHNYDLSLGEIAENLNITRQAVYDNLKRAESSLDYYEKKMKLADIFLKKQEQLSKIEKQILEYRNKAIDNQDKQLIEILDCIWNIIQELSID